VRAQAEAIPKSVEHKQAECAAEQDRKGMKQSCEAQLKRKD
jgi:hypothetical protein